MTLRMSLFSCSFCNLAIDNTRPRAFRVNATEIPCMRSWGAIRRSSLVSHPGDLGQAAECASLLARLGQRGEKLGGRAGPILQARALPEQDVADG